MPKSPTDINLTDLIRRSADGNLGSNTALYDAVYDQLKEIAVRMLRFGKSELNTTALVHECYLKVSDWDTASIGDRKHFYAICAKAMRHIIIDDYRKVRTEKRAFVKVELDDELMGHLGCEAALVRLDEALKDLQHAEPDIALVIELRVFSGLDPQSIATLFETTPRNIYRWLKTGKTFVEMRMV